MLKKNLSNIILGFLVIFFIVLFVFSISSVNKVFSFDSEDGQGTVLGASIASPEIIPLASPTGSLVKLEPSQKRVLTPNKLDESGECSFSADKGIVFDCRTGSVLFKKNAELEAPIASITKLVAVYVFLDYNPGWETTYVVEGSDITNGGRIYLSVGDEVKIKDLFYLSLVGSANTATRALVSATELSEEEFVAAMNKKMDELGLNSTRFEDPIGLSSNNISTALEIAQFSNIALNNDIIREATLRNHYEFRTVGNKIISVNSTDSLLSTFPENGITLLGGKTGYTKAAGYCFVGKFKNEAGHEIVTVVLGGDQPSSRFRVTKDLVEWVYDSYKWE